MRILFSGVGGPTPRSFALAIKQDARFKDVVLVGTDINPLAIGLYQKELFSKSYLLPPADDANYRNAVNKIIKKESIEYAIVMPEMEVISWSQWNEEEGLPCRALLPPLNLARALVDKSKMTEILEGMDLVPASVSFYADQKDWTALTEELGEDFWVRSSTGSSGLGSLRISSKKALENWIQLNPEVSHFLASKFLPGRNLACKLLYYDGNLIRSALGERVSYIMSKVAPSGITGNTSFGRLLNDPNVVDEAIRAMNRIFEYIGVKRHGFFTVDFKEDENGKPYITEINVRHVAFTQCFAAGGANFAADTLDLLSGNRSFDKTYRMYTFEEGLIFLRDVDASPILMREKDLLRL